MAKTFATYTVETYAPFYSISSYSADKSSSDVSVQDYGHELLIDKTLEGYGEEVHWFAKPADIGKWDTDIREFYQPGDLKISIPLAALARALVVILGPYKAVDLTIGLAKVEKPIDNRDQPETIYYSNFRRRPMNHCRFNMLVSCSPGSLRFGKFNFDTRSLTTYLRRPAKGFTYFGNVDADVLKFSRYAVTKEVENDFRMYIENAVRQLLLYFDGVSYTDAMLYMGACAASVYKQYGVIGDSVVGDPITDFGLESRYGDIEYIILKNIVEKHSFGQGIRVDWTGRQILCAVHGARLHAATVYSFSPESSNHYAVRPKDCPWIVKELAEREMSVYKGFRIFAGSYPVLDITPQDLAMMMNCTLDRPGELVMWTFNIGTEWSTWVRICNFLARLLGNCPNVAVNNISWPSYSEETLEIINQRLTRRGFSVQENTKLFFWANKGFPTLVKHDGTINIVFSGEDIIRFGSGHFICQSHERIAFMSEYYDAIKGLLTGSRRPTPPDAPKMKHPMRSEKDDRDKIPTKAKVADATVEETTGGTPKATAPAVPPKPAVAEKQPDAKPGETKPEVKA